MNAPTDKSNEQLFKPIFIDFRESNNKLAVQLLDIFTKIWCRDTRVTDDLKFMCEECPFKMSGGRCAVKRFKCEVCPEYKDFGAMGDL